MAVRAYTGRQFYQCVDSAAQLQAWREDAAIQAFLRSELTTLNLDSSTPELRQLYLPRELEQAWCDHNLAALLHSMPQINSLNLSTAVVENADNNPYALLSRSRTGRFDGSSVFQNSQPVRPRCSPISTAFCRHTQIVGSFGRRWRP